MENKPIAPALTYDELQAQIKELQQEREKLTTALQAANGETNKTKYALRFAEKDRQDAVKTAENLAVLLANSQSNPQQPQILSNTEIELEKFNTSVKTLLMLWAANTEKINKVKITNALYLFYLMQGISKDAQQAAYQKAKAEAQRLVDSELPKSELPANLLTQTIQRPTNENEQF